jgi:hypothetical protein
MSPFALITILPLLVSAIPNAPAPTPAQHLDKRANGANTIGFALSGTTCMLIHATAQIPLLLTVTSRDTNIRQGALEAATQDTSQHQALSATAVSITTAIS